MNGGGDAKQDNGMLCRGLSQMRKDHKEDEGEEREKMSPSSQR